MDGNLSTVIIAIITGLFSTVSILIKNRQEKVITKIDEQNQIIEKEKLVKDHLDQLDKECRDIVQDIIVLILDTNLSLLSKHGDFSDARDLELKSRSEEYKRRLNDVRNSINDLGKEYEMILNVSNLYREELKKIQGRTKKS
jgi:hypothetical protein